MDLEGFDNKCVRITATSGEVYEGTVSYCGEEYVYHEYGEHQEALLMTPILFYKDDISSIISLEDVEGPFGHYSEAYGLLEKKCLEWGTDMMGEVLESEDGEQILRMLHCMSDNVRTLVERSVPGMAPWRSGSSMPKDSDEEPVYQGELETMLETLVKYNQCEEIVKEAKLLLERLTAETEQ